VDLWLLGFSFILGFDPVLVWVVFDVFWGTCFGVSFGFRLVLVRNKYKWDWIVGFGEDQVSFGWFSKEFHRFFCFFF